MRVGMIAAAIGCLAAVPQRASAGQPQIGGYVQVWWTAYEQLENESRQVGGDLARQQASGFSLRRARVAFRDTLSSARVWWKIEALLEGSARLTDCFLAAQLAEGLVLRVGQMKIPSSYEAMAPTTWTDFVERATVSSRLVDWSLSRTPYTSTFTGNRAFLRDIGVAVVGDIGPVRGIGMVGNGLGANLFVGGKQRGEFVHSNGFGDWMYALRVDTDLLDWLTVGGHGLLNRHDDMLFNDERTVIDLDRRSWSADALVSLPHGTRVRGLYAGGVVDDDFYRDGRKNYEYTGYEMKAMYWLRPQQLEVGLRFDSYGYEFSESGNRTVQDNLTVGINRYWGGRNRLQVNYTWKKTEEASAPDLDDDILLANLQFAF